MLLLLALALQDPAVDVRARAWFAQFDGATLADGKAGAGTRVGVDELGLDGAEAAPDLELNLRVPGVGRFSAELWRLKLEGSETLGGDLVYDDDFFPAGTAVDASLELNLFSLDYGFALVAVDRFRLEGEAQFLYVAGRAELEGGGTTSKTKLNRPLLMPGASAVFEAAPWLELEADVHGIAFSTANVALRWLELEVEALARPWKGLTLGIGYRLYRVDVKATEDSTNFDLDGSLHGPFVEVGWTF